jgi:6-phosphofructokinase 1
MADMNSAADCMREGDHAFVFAGVETRVLDGSATPAEAAAGLAPAAPMAITTLVRFEVPRLQRACPQGDQRVPNTREPLPTYAEPPAGSRLSMAAASPPPPGANARVPYLNVIDESYVIAADIVRHAGQAPTSRCFVRAGPREVCYFEPHSVVAAIVTCGGLCPGLNNVVREIVLTLHNTYGARKVFGVQKGYWGFHTPDADESTGRDRAPSCPTFDNAVVLTPESVANIHEVGGTVLGSDRGGLNKDSSAKDVDIILRFCQNRGVNQLYIIGGDGTHRGADAVASEAVRRGLPISVAAIPKTIDNDVDIIDRSFGFETAYAEAQQAIRSAKTEASAAFNGLGIVKLMGRHAGFIAAHAAMASGDVDLCLIPEVPVVFSGPASFGAHVLSTIRRKGYAVVVVAEGAGEKEILAEQQQQLQKDAGGNTLLPEVGPWLKAKFVEYLKARGCAPTVKFIDPSYMIRSVAPHAADAEYCMLLGQNAVHGAMAGFTGFSTGLVNNRMVYLPIAAITANSPRRMNARGRTYERLLQLTRQPDPLQFVEEYKDSR